MFAAQELATAVQYRLAVVVVVFNNNAFGNVLRDQTEQFAGRDIGSRLTNPDFVRFAESFDVGAQRVIDLFHEHRAEGFAGLQPQAALVELFGESLQTSTRRVAHGRTLSLTPARTARPRGPSVLLPGLPRQLGLLGR